MKKLAILTMLVILTLLVMSPIVLAAGYGAMRAPVAFNPGCNTGACGTMANIGYVQQAPIVQRNVTTYNEVTVQRQVDVPVYRDVPVLRDVPVYRDVPVARDVPVYRDVPVVRQRAFAPSCNVGYGVGCGVASSTVVRTPRVFVGSSGFGTNVQVGRVGVQAAPGQAVDVRRGGLRGVLFGTRVRVR